MHSWSGDLQGVSKGGSNDAVRCLKKLVCFPFWPSGESEDRTEGPQLLLCILSCQHKKVWPPAGDQLPAEQSLNHEPAILSHCANTHTVNYFYVTVLRRPKPPLCKGRWAAVRLLGGVDFVGRRTIPQSASLTIACGQSGRGSDSPQGCHSLPRLRFAYPLHKGAFVCSTASLFKE